MQLSKVQHEIVTAPLGSAIVTAGAGSGKTRVLTERFAHVITDLGIPRDGIIALTFTNKAAAEMKRRVEEILPPEMCPLCMSLTCYLGTFHSWCARFLRSYICAPWTQSFTIYDTKDSDKVWKKLGCEDYVDREDKADEYRAALEKSNAIDFDMLLELTYEILGKNREVRERLQNKMQYILVDEFQDTNEIQYKIVKTLAERHRNIMVVGDEDQCIYSWRGASAENLNRFRRDFPDTKIYKLEQNFRSSGNIVGLANKLVSNNQNRLDKVLFSDLENGKIQCSQYYDERHEAQTVAMTIKSEHGRGVDYKNFAVLMRLNATSRYFEEQFRAFGIPHIIWGGFKFYERAEIKSTLNYLRLLVNPRDTVAQMDVLNFPKRGLGDVTVTKIMNGDTATLTKKAREGYDRYLDTMRALQNLADNATLTDLAEEIVPTIGLGEYFKTGKEEDESRLENVYQLVQAIKDFAKSNPDATLGDYLQTVSLVQDTDNGGNGDAVVISTVHSAKGLEFDNVFVIGLEDGTFPMFRAKESSAQMEEERRLLYVAITRARKNLYLSHCESRFIHGTRTYPRPSEFLVDCGLVKPAPKFRDYDTW